MQGLIYQNGQVTFETTKSNNFLICVHHTEASWLNTELRHWFKRDATGLLENQITWLGVLSGSIHWWNWPFPLTLLLCCSNHNITALSSRVTHLPTIYLSISFHSHLQEHMCTHTQIHTHSLKHTNAHSHILSLFQHFHSNNAWSSYATLGSQSIDPLQPQVTRTAPLMHSLTLAVISSFGVWKLMEWLEALFMFIVTGSLWAKYSVRGSCVL